MNKYTHTKYIHTAALCIDSKMGKAVVQDHSTWLVKRKKNQTHAHTGMHAHMQKWKQKPNICQHYTQSTRNINSVFYNDFLIPKMPILCVYIYIFFSVVYYWFILNILVLLCGRQLDRHEHSKDNRQGTEGHQGGKPQVTSNQKNWENKDIVPRVIFPSLTYHRSCASDTLLTFPPLACC